MIISFNWSQIFWDAIVLNTFKKLEWKGECEEEFEIPSKILWKVNVKILLSVEFIFYIEFCFKKQRIYLL